MYYEVGAKQIQGGRDYQEDSFQVFFPENSDVDKRQALVVLADGMGGHAGGAVASEIVVEKVLRCMSKDYPPDNLPAALLSSTEEANRAVQERAREHPELQGMGCTLVAFNLDQKALHWISVGDSLLYLIRNGEVIRKNDDHSYGGYMDRLIAAGEDIPETPGFTPRRNMLMSYVNGEEIAMIDCPDQGHELRPGDRIIAASDGLDTISSDDFPNLSKNANTAQEFADALVEAVEAAGKKNQDNTTVVVVDVIGSPGDDTTQDTPGDWVGETFLPSLDESEGDDTVQELEIHEAPSSEEAVVDKPEVSKTRRAAQEAASGIPPIDSAPQVRVSPPVVKKNNTPVITAIAATVVALLAGVSYFFLSGDGSSVEGQNQSISVLQPSVPPSVGPEQAVVLTPVEPSIPSVPEIIQDRLKSGGSGPRMAILAAGEFTQGSSTLSPAFEERPARQVSLPAFALSITEITFAEYGAFVAAVGGRLPADQGWGRNLRPVINVSWDDARAYAAWLSSQTGHRYRLATESEWEYAARAGTTQAYWWGRKAGHNKANCWGCGSEWDGVKTAPVGSFQPNPWGIFDTSGNVLEWVADCMHPSYEDAPLDGSAWQQSGCPERVVRGGSWSNPADGSRVAKRLGMRADVRQDNLGFRLVRELD